MFSFSIFEVVLVSIILLTNIVLSWISIAKAKNKRQGISLGSLILVIDVWVGAAFLSERIPEIELKVLLTKITYASVLLATSFLVIFFNSLRKTLRFAKLLDGVALALGVMSGLICLFTDKIIQGVALRGQSFDIIFGPFSLPVFALILAMLSAGGISLYKGYRESSDEEKKSFQLLLIGLVIFVLANIVVNAILPIFISDQNYYRFGNYSVIFLTSLTAYSIVARKLFQIKTIAAVVFAILINIFLIAEIFLSNSLTEALLKGLISIAVGIGSYSLVKNISQEIFRREEVEKLAAEKTGALAELEQRNKNLATLQRVSEIVMNETDMKQMTQHILDEFPKQMDDCIGALLNIVKDDHLLPYTFTENELTKKIHGIIGTDLSKYSEPIKKGYNLLHDSLIEKREIHSDSLADFISPPIPKPVAMTVQRLIGAKSFEAMPLYAGGEPFGVMLFVFSATAEELRTKNLDIAKSIADEMSLAVQRAQAFQKLKEANEYLKQLDKMKDEFISMASHELNTPLAAIEGYLSMILDEHMGQVDAKSQEYLSRAYDSSKRLAALILDLLNVSRIEQGRLKMKFAQVNLADIAEAVIKELQVKSDAKKIYLKVEADKANVPLTWCDPDRIRQVITNLTGNAIKFTETGGVTIKITGDAGMVHVAVVDTGRGIAKEDQALLFGKFSQVKREVDEQQGTGLGLYISKNYVELHNGKIWVESEAGKGAAFKFDLPIIDKPPLEVKGAVLEQQVISAPQIELRKEGEVPQIITDSSKAPVPDPTVTRPVQSAPVAEKVA